MTITTLNLTNPGQEPADGDLMKYSYPNGASETKQYFAPLPSAPAVEPPDPCQWLIDVGPFFDRFGAAKMAVLTSQHAVVKAILSDVMVRKWVNLNRPDVASALDAIGSIVPELTPAIKTAILTMPVTVAENMALRKLFFS